MQRLLGPQVLHHLNPAQASALTGRAFFPQLMSSPFSSAPGTAFTFAFVACAVAAVAPLLRGGRYHFWFEEGPAADRADPAPADPAGRPARVPATGES